MNVNEIELKDGFAVDGEMMQIAQHRESKKYVVVVLDDTEIVAKHSLYYADKQSCYNAIQKRTVLWATEDRIRELLGKVNKEVMG